MLGQLYRGTRPWVFRCLLAMVVLGVWAAVASAQSENTIMAVEEDWELVIGTPDPENDSPQIVCMISPLGGVSGLYCTFELNHQTNPSFVAGGLQLQVWNGGVSLQAKTYTNPSTLATSGEVVRWTQRIEVAGSTLHFEIVGGQSTTWGSFGGEGLLKASINSEIQDLSTYNPAVSTTNSGVNFASHRVDSLVLRKVRYIKADGAVEEDNTTRPVYQPQ